MAQRMDEVVVHVPQGTKSVTIKIEPGPQAQEQKDKPKRRKICD